MKKFLLVAVFAVAAFTVSAQTEDEAKAGEAQDMGRTKFSLGVEAGLPIGEAADFFGSALGGSIKVEIPVTAEIKFTGSGGYSVLSYSDDQKAILQGFGMNTKPETYIPLKVGGKYFFSKNIYGAAELGGVVAVARRGSNGFIWAPGVGISYPVSDRYDIDAGLRYESWEQGSFTTSQIGVHVAFKF
jgi:opacity protein-like surface antigen